MRFAFKNNKIIIQCCQAHDNVNDNVDGENNSNPAERTNDDEVLLKTINLCCFWIHHFKNVKK